jgi:PAS domain S-box-containing protein
VYCGVHVFEEEGGLAVFSELANEAPDALFALSLGGDILSWNRGSEALFGYTAAEAIGQSLERLLVPDDQRDEARRELSATGDVTRAFEATRRHKSGTLIVVAVAMRRLDPAGAQPYIAVSMRDVTRLRRLESERATMREASLRKSEFLVNMSHELRTPLNAIIGFAALMHRDAVGTLSMDHKEYVGDILTSAEHLLQLINDVLDLAKVESGKMEFRHERIDLPRLVEKACSLLRELATSKRLQIDIEIDPTISTVAVDPGRLKQVLYNYLSNAIKFTPAGGTITVRIGPANDPSEFRIDVEDTGIGIAEEHLSTLFVQFQQLDAGKRHPGTGLGLVLTKRIVEGHGGRVELRSVLGKGSTFSAILPRAAPPAIKA